jgi:hypothetical protein
MLRRPASFLGLLGLLAACGDDTDGSGAASSASASASTTTSGPTTSSDTSTTSSGTGATGGAGGFGGADPWNGPLEHLAELELGEADIGDTIMFPIPDRAIGLTTFSTTAESGLLGIVQLRPPSSDSVILSFEIPGTNAPFFIDQGVITGASPQSDLPDAWPVKEGEWRLRLGSDGPTLATSSVFVRRTSDGAFHGGVVDVNVFIAPSAGVDQGYMTSVVDQVFTGYYGPGIGLTKGTVTFHGLSDGYAIIDSDEELGEMFASSAGVGPAPALNLFVVADFDNASALGIAGGIPGSPMVHGTKRSGVAYTPTGDQGYDASVVAHEMGHLSGLFHTSELQVDAFDPFVDTVTCPGIQDMDPADCPDTGNVMFPIAYGGATFSPLQARAVQGSAIYRGILEAGGQPGPSLPSPVPVTPRPAPRASYLLPAETSRPLVTPLERTLGAHYCERFADIEAHVAHVLAPSGDALAAASLDPDLPDRARARSLRLLVRTDPSRAARIASSLLNGTTPRRLALSAITILDQEAPSELTALVEAHSPFADPAVEIRLERLGFSR